jgi:hypothetical protein
LGPFVLLEVQFTLPTVQLILLADILTHPSLIKANCAYFYCNR